jgi:diadenosine tetraphosphate (Ap4A) HIT family hydrolase
MDKCPFCNSDLMKSQTLYKSENFFIIDNNRPITHKHILLITRKHIRSETEIDDTLIAEYSRMNKLAFNHMHVNTGRDPMVFINAKQDQSVPHFHKHYVDGVFGYHGVDVAIRNHLIERAKKIALDKE